MDTWLMREHLLFLQALNVDRARPVCMAFLTAARQGMGQGGREALFKGLRCRQDPSGEDKYV